MHLGALGYASEGMCYQSGSDTAVYPCWTVIHSAEGGVERLELYRLPRVPSLRPSTTMSVWHHRALVVLLAGAGAALARGREALLENDGSITPTQLNLKSLEDLERRRWQRPRRSARVVAVLHAIKKASADASVRWRPVRGGTRLACWAGGEEIGSTQGENACARASGRPPWHRVSKPQAKNVL